jgi:hypothetical protein
MIVKRPYSDMAQLPGVAPVEGREFCYVQGKEVKSFQRLFPKITSHAKIGLPHHGGMIEENAIIGTPDGRLFFGLSYAGDIEGWRANVEACCAALALSWARVDA